MKSSIICVGAGSSQLSLILAIKKAGYKCVAFDRNPNAPGKSEADFFSAAVHMIIRMQ